MKQARLLDLYSCAGGAAKGYMDAGFSVVGVDITSQPHYIGDDFYQDDALSTLDTLLAGETWHGYTLSDFDAIHASPECKGYTQCNLSPKEKYEKQIVPVRVRLKATGKPYVIENVEGAKHELHGSLMLCATMFGVQMKRHRLFESNVFLYPPAACHHTIARYAVYGHSVWDLHTPGTTRKDGRARPDSVPIAVGREVMGIDWMGIEELAESLPPVYTRWIGQHLLDAIEQARSVA